MDLEHRRISQLTLELSSRPSPGLMQALLLLGKHLEMLLKLYQKIEDCFLSITIDGPQNEGAFTQTKKYAGLKKRKMEARTVSEFQGMTRLH